MPRVTHRLLRTPEWLRGEYLERGREQQDLADELGVDRSTITAAITRHGLQRGPRFPQLQDRDWLAGRYGSGLTQDDIAAELGCSRSAVATAMRRHGLRGRVPKAVRYPQLQDDEWLRGRLEAGWTQRRIAEEVGCAEPTVQHAVRRLRTDDL